MSRIPRLCGCAEVYQHLESGTSYTFSLKSGTDGQTGRGCFMFKGKQVNDNKR